jgi:hypothetical protein
MSVPDHSVGRRVQCPHCESVFRYTGQKELTLGRVRQAATSLAGAAVGGGLIGATIVPVTAKAVAAKAPLVTPGKAFDDDQAFPIEDLPELEEDLLDEPELIDDAELEMFRSEPADTALPEVSDAEIEALFEDAQAEAGGQRPESAPNIRSTAEAGPLSAALPNLELGASGPIDLSEADIAEIFEGESSPLEVDDAEVLDAELELAAGDVLEADDVDLVDEVVVDEEAVVEISGEDMAHAQEVLETLPIPQAKPGSNVPIAPVLKAQPVVGAVPVAGMPIGGIPRAHVAAAAPATIAPALPVSKDPIPPPTPAPHDADDVDLDALFEESLEEAPEIGEVAKGPAEHDTVVPPAAEDDLDLMALFEDETDAAPSVVDSIEISRETDFDDRDFVFRDEPPEKPAKKE